MRGRPVLSLSVMFGGLTLWLSAQSNFYTLTSDHYVFWAGRQSTVYLNGHWYTAFFYSDDSLGPKYPGIVRLDSLARTLSGKVIWRFPALPTVYGLTVRTDQTLLWFLALQDTFIFVTLTESLVPVEVWRFVLDSPITLVRWCLSSDSVVWMYGRVSDAPAGRRHRLLKVNLQSQTIMQWRVQSSNTPYGIACRPQGTILYLLNAREADEEAYIVPIPVAQLDSPAVTFTGYGVNINVVGTWGTPLLHIYPVWNSDSIVLVVGHKKGGGISASDALVGYFVYPNARLVFKSFGSALRSDYPCGASASDPYYHVASAVSVKAGGRNFTVVLAPDLSAVMRKITFDGVFNYPTSRRCHTSSAPHGFLIVGEWTSRLSDTLGNTWYGSAELRWAFVHQGNGASWTCGTPLEDDVWFWDSIRSGQAMWTVSVPVYRVNDPVIRFQENGLPYDTVDVRDLRVMPFCLSGLSVEVVSSSLESASMRAPWQIQAVRYCAGGFIVEIVCQGQGCSGRNLMVGLHTLQGKTIASTRAALMRSGVPVAVFLKTGRVLLPGVYLLTVTDGTFIETVKLVVPASWF